MDGWMDLYLKKGNCSGSGTALALGRDPHLFYLARGSNVSFGRRDGGLYPPPTLPRCHCNGLCQEVLKKDRPIEYVNGRLLQPPHAAPCKNGLIFFLHNYFAPFF